MEWRGEFCGEEYQRRVAGADSDEKIAHGACFFSLFADLFWIEEWVFLVCKSWLTVLRICFRFGFFPDHITKVIFLTRSLSTLFCRYLWKNKQSTCLIDYKDVQNTCENLEHCRLHVENLRYKKTSRCIAKSVNLLSNCLTKVKMIFFGSIHSIIKLYRKRYQSTSLIIEIFSKHLSINLPQFCRCHYTSQNFNFVKCFTLVVENKM